MQIETLDLPEEMNEEDQTTKDRYYATREEACT